MNVRLIASMIATIHPYLDLGTHRRSVAQLSPGHEARREIGEESYGAAANSTDRWDGGEGTSHPSV